MNTASPVPPVALPDALGLPAGAPPEQVAVLRDDVARYLASAPDGIRGWAGAQSSLLGIRQDDLGQVDALHDTAPGGAAPEAQDDADFAALYALVTPSAHPDMAPAAVRARPAAATAQRAAQAPPNPWKRATLAMAAVMAAGVILFAGSQISAGASKAPAAAAAAGALPAASVPPLDEAKVAALMAQLAASPKDASILAALGDAYYASGILPQAGSFYDQALAIDPGNVAVLLARGGVYFDAGDDAGAGQAWKKAVALAPGSQEAHYNLGFLYLNSAAPDWAAVQSEWGAVIAIDPTTQLAKTVQSHLTALAASSMIPAQASPAAPAAPSAAPSYPAGAPTP